MNCIIDCCCSSAVGDGVCSGIGHVPHGNDDVPVLRNQTHDSVPGFDTCEGTVRPTIVRCGVELIPSVDSCCLLGCIVL